MGGLYQYLRSCCLVSKLSYQRYLSSASKPWCICWRAILASPSQLSFLSSTAHVAPEASCPNMSHYWVQNVTVFLIHRHSVSACHQHPLDHSSDHLHHFPLRDNTRIATEDTAADLEMSSGNVTDGI